MDSLAKAFVYFGAMSWAGTETLLLAADGVRLPLYVALIIFGVGFVLVGCYPFSDETVERLGKGFFAIVAVSCLIFALGSFAHPLQGTLKLACAAALCVFVLKAPVSGGSSHPAHH